VTRANDRPAQHGQAARAEQVVVRRPLRQTLPVVVSSPHSGRDYDCAFLGLSRLDALAIRRSEDAFVDEIVARAPQLGAPLVAARFPRAWLDVNREPYELDPAMFDGPLPAWVNSRSPRVKAGLGTVPRVVAGGAEIYRGKLPPGEAEARIKGCYMPYHDALVELLEATRASFGAACLVDVHSMPSAGQDGGRSRVDAVIGDRFGASCDRSLTEAASGCLRDRGLQVRRNEPYPGGFITEHYGRPELGLHAIQIELNRGLYMDEKAMTRGTGLAPLARHVEALLQAVAAAVLTLSRPASAAE
jgi:N-formylglutamate amidohydrolase